MDAQKKAGNNEKAVRALPDTRPIMKSNDAALHHSENKYSVAACGNPSSRLEAVFSWPFPSKEGADSDPRPRRTMVT
jgi:hypothetical protein